MHTLVLFEPVQFHERLGADRADVAVLGGTAVRRVAAPVHAQTVTVDESGVTVLTLVWPLAYMSEVSVT